MSSRVVFVGVLSGFGWVPRLTARRSMRQMAFGAFTRRLYNAPMTPFDSPRSISRRAVLKAVAGAAAVLANTPAAFALAPPGFDQWRDSFRARALAKGISDAT